MKKLFITILCFCSTLSFAQNGFFLQPEIGAGISNTSWKPSSSEASYPGQRNIFSYQGQLDIGYKAGKWQFISGVGYLRTGVNLTKGTLGYFDNFVLADPLYVLSGGVTAYDPHVIIPFKIGYEVHRFNNKLSFIPVIGAELSYNQPRTFVYAYQKQKVTETMENFNDNCNKHGTIALLQLNFEYRLNNRYNLTFGPSVHYMFSSELNFKDQHDYSMLMNTGLKWNFKKRKQVM